LAPPTRASLVHKVLACPFQVLFDIYVQQVILKNSSILTKVGKAREVERKIDASWKIYNFVSAWVIRHRLKKVIRRVLEVTISKREQS
jgi:hypothetical protein